MLNTDDEPLPAVGPDAGHELLVVPVPPASHRVRSSAHQTSIKKARNPGISIQLVSKELQTLSMSLRYNGYMATTTTNGIK